MTTINARPTWGCFEHFHPRRRAVWVRPAGGHGGREPVMSDAFAYLWLYLKPAQRRATTAATHRPESFQPPEDTLVSTFTLIPFSFFHLCRGVGQLSRFRIESKHRELIKLISGIFFTICVYLYLFNEFITAVCVHVSLLRVTFGAEIV